LNNFKTNTEKSNDDILWNQLRAGDEEAFSLLFEKYFSTLVNYGKTLTTEPNTVKDCVQDVFVDIWTYRHSLNEAVVVKAYLLSSVRKRLARQHEREHIFLRTKDLDSLDFLFDFSIEDRLIADEAMTAKVGQLNLLINKLPPRQKEALYLRYHQGLSVEQVSEVLNMNYQSTKNLLHRSILQLRKDFPAPLLSLFYAVSVNY
jgi:RNA polymerase sigma factor (sigma-70 family)